MSGDALKKAKELEARTQQKIDEEVKKTQKMVNGAEEKGYAMANKLEGKATRRIARRVVGTTWSFPERGGLCPPPRTVAL